MSAINFVVIGGGAWGTAIAVHLAKMHDNVVLVPRNESKAKTLRDARENTERLPGISLPESLKIDVDFAAHINSESILCLACPTQGLTELCGQLQRIHLPKIPVISLMKGFGKDSLKLPSQVIQSFLPQVLIGSLSGPTYAREFAKGLPAAMVLGADEALKYLPPLFSNSVVNVSFSEDRMGVELGGCLKNSYAIGAGIIDGLQLGDNARAAYLSSALTEMVKIGTYLGGKKDTFYGLSGLGDLIATTQGSWSRNRQIGFEVAQGHSIEHLLQSGTVEGYSSLLYFYGVLQKAAIKAPILDALYAIFYKNCSVCEVANNLVTAC